MGYGLAATNRFVLQDISLIVTHTLVSNLLPRPNPVRRERGSSDQPAKRSNAARDGVDSPQVGKFSRRGEKQIDEESTWVIIANAV